MRTQCLEAKSVLRKGIPGAWRGFVFFALGGLWLAEVSASGQVNSWVKPESGNWEDPEWSLGVPPGAGQSIFITNAGWKTVWIGPTATQSYPGSMTIGSLTVSSPPGSSNTLFMNHAGQQTPLTVPSILVASNSGMRMAGSGLFLNGGPGVGLSIGGEFNQEAGSTVTGQQMDVGWVGPGVYNLQDGTLTLQQVWLGGPYSGVLNQSGGSNGVGVVHLEAGQYNLSGGDLNSDLYFEEGTLRQTGGRLLSGLKIHFGTYLLEGGESYGTLAIPIYAYGNGSATAVQTGGTNFADLELGLVGGGSYLLSNGVSTVSSLTAGHWAGRFLQAGGIQRVAGTTDVRAGPTTRNNYGYGTFELYGGSFAAEKFLLSGHYLQTAGTNIVSGEFIYDGMFADVRLEGGLLCSRDMSVVPSFWYGPVAFVQSGGLQVITNQLSVTGKGDLWWEGFQLVGGELAVSNITLDTTLFTKEGAGVLKQSGVLAMVATDFHLGEGAHQFGPLRLDAGSNSIVYLPGNMDCVVRFRDSAALAWAGGLTISNWTGNGTGGGVHQIIFGENSGALTPEQLNRILFLDPAGQAPGIYAAKILEDGEIVPGSLPPTGRTPPRLVLAPSSNGMELTLHGDAGANYGVEISEDLDNWTLWTTQVNINGTMSLMDTNAAEQRFYRALLMP